MSEKWVVGASNRLQSGQTRSGALQELRAGISAFKQVLMSIFGALYAVLMRILEFGWTSGGAGGHRPLASKP